MIYTMSIEIKIPDKEIYAMADEAICKAKSVDYRELTLNELESATGGRILKTGEVITEKVIDEYAAILRNQKATSDVLIFFSEDMGFYPLDYQGIAGCNYKYEGAWIDYWVTKQKSMVRKEREGLSFLDQFSTG
jgi:hypothetical protein